MKLVNYDQEQRCAQGGGQLGLRPPASVKIYSFNGGGFTGPTSAESPLERKKTTNSYVHHWSITMSQDNNSMKN